MITSAAHAATTVVLFSDDFEGRTTGSGDGNGNPAGAGNGSSDWGTNNNNLGGTNTAAYITSPSFTGGRNQVVGVNQFDGTLGSHGHFVAGDVIVGYQGWLGDAPDGFEVAFRFDRNTDPASTGGGYLAVGLGVNTLNPADLGGQASIVRSNFGVLFQQANAGNAANGDAFQDNVSIGNFDYLDPNAPADVVLAVTPTLSGQYGIGASLN